MARVEHEDVAVTEPDVKTLADLPFHVSGRFPKPVLLQRCREDGTDDLSSREVFDRIRDLSLGLSDFGVRAGDRVALVSESRPEWTIADLAILTAGAVTVPVYPTLPAEHMQVILADCGARFVIASDEEQAAKIRSVRRTLSSIETMAVIDAAGDGGADETPAEVPLAVVAARGHTRLIAEDGLGRRYREAVAGFDPDEVATIIYTSGTTGVPKGVMLTHANILSNMLASRQVISMTSDDTALSFLPLSHSFERTTMYRYLYEGVTVAFAESLETIGRDLQAIAPTIMTGVPRVYEKVQARVLASVAQAPAVRPKDLRVGARRRAVAHLAGVCPPARALARAVAGPAGRPIGVCQDPRPHWRPTPADHLGRGGARARAGRVLLCGRDADRRRLRLDGDGARADHQPPGGDPGSGRSARRFLASS